MKWIRSPRPALSADNKLQECVTKKMAPSLQIPGNFSIATNGSGLGSQILQKFSIATNGPFSYSDEWVRLSRFRGSETNKPRTPECFILLDFPCFWAPKLRFSRRASRAGWRSRPQKFFYSDEWSIFLRRSCFRDSLRNFIIATNGPFLFETFSCT